MEEVGGAVFGDVERGVRIWFRFLVVASLVTLPFFLPSVDGAFGM